MHPGSLMIIRRAMLIFGISFGHVFCWSTKPILTFKLNAAPDALIYSICGLTAAQLTGQLGNWTSGIHAALIVNDSYIFESLMQWGQVESRVQDDCLSISVDPERLSSGQAVVQALLCDAQKLCFHEFKSPALKIAVNSDPFTVFFFDDNSSEWPRAEPFAQLSSRSFSSADVTANPSQTPVINRTKPKQADDTGFSDNKPLQSFEPAIHPNKTAVCGFASRKQNESEIRYVSIDPAPADTLILFAFSHSDGWREENLLFWLARGLVPDSRYHFVLIVNGRIDAAWRRLLDRVSAGLACFEWHQRPDAGRDVCAWHSVLSGSVRLRRALASFARFVLTNASCRGPFLPGYYRRPWPEAFLSVLGARVALSGVTLHCDCLDPHPRSERCVCGPDLHIQSYLLAFGASLLPLVLGLQRQACVANSSRIMVCSRIRRFIRANKSSNP